MLTDWETRRGRDIAHARRRVEWVAGRIAVKWLVLRQTLSAASARREAASHAWPPEMWLVGERELQIFAPERYRQLEVSRDEHGAPSLVAMSGLDTADIVGTRVSIAHSHGWAMAAVGSCGGIGVDIEAVAPRHPGFFESVLSDRERKWMRGLAERDANRLGTLLWVLKEAFLKTGASIARSVWEIGAIELDIPRRADSVLEHWPHESTSAGAPATPRLLSLPIRSTVDHAAAQMHAAYSAFGDMIVGVVAVTVPESTWPPPSDARGWSVTTSVTSDSI